jgi:hypothetical protein
VLAVHGGEDGLQGEARWVVRRFGVGSVETDAHISHQKSAVSNALTRALSR